MLLRVQVDSCGPADLTALTTISLGGTPAICNHHLLWIQAVQDYFDDVPLFVSCRRLLQLVCDTALQVGLEGTSTETVVANSGTNGGNLKCFGCMPDWARTACNTASLDDVMSCL